MAESKRVGGMRIQITLEYGGEIYVKEIPISRKVKLSENITDIVRKRKNLLIPVFTFSELEKITLTHNR
jgi:hypothetical protein